MCLTVFFHKIIKMTCANDKKKHEHPLLVKKLVVILVSLEGMYFFTLLDKVDVWVVAILGPPGAASREGAEESVGEQTGHLLLGHCDGVTHVPLQERDRLEEEQTHN